MSVFAPDLDTVELQGVGLVVTRAPCVAAPRHGTRADAGGNGDRPADISRVVAPRTVNHSTRVAGHFRVAPAVSLSAVFVVEVA